MSKQSKKKKQRKTIFVSLVGLGILIVLLGSFFIYRKSQPKVPTAELPVKVEHQPQKTLYKQRSNEVTVTVESADE